jgi:hypothetical protein
MNLFFLHHPAKNPNDLPGNHTLVAIPEEIDSSEGSEFLDDAIRMKDQPLIYSEKDVVAERPDDSM